MEWLEIFREGPEAPLETLKHRGSARGHALVRILLLGPRRRPGEKNQRIAANLAEADQENINGAL